MKLPRALAAIAMIACSIPAEAKLLSFKISGGYNAEFRLDSSPLPASDNVVPGYLFGIADVPFVGANSGPFGVTFFNIAGGGGILVNDGFDYLLDASGPQLYTGAENMPTFREDNYVLTGVSTPGTFTLVVSAVPVPVPVPEPATWALLVAGFAGVGLALRRAARRARAAA